MANTMLRQGNYSIICARRNAGDMHAKGGE